MLCSPSGLRVCGPGWAALTGSGAAVRGNPIAPPPSTALSFSPPRRCGRSRAARALCQSGRVSEPERTADGRFVVIGGRRWRTSDPGIPDALRIELVAELMAARRAVRDAGGDRTAASDAGDAVQQMATCRVGVTAHGEQQVGLVGDDVVLGARLKAADRHDRRVLRIEFAADEGLEGAHDIRAKDYRVLGRMWDGAVAAHSAHLDIDGVDVRE